MKHLFLFAVMAFPMTATIIVNDPSNPYWFTEGEVAKATAEKMGYTASVNAHKGDTNAESTMIDTAITNKSVAIILDPANADFASVYTLLMCCSSRFTNTQ